MSYPHRVGGASTRPLEVPELRAGARVRLMPVLYLAVFAAGFALRFWELSQAPVWMDEAFSHMASMLPMKPILLNQIDNHPPLFYALQHLWHGLDPSLADVRVPAAMAGGLTVVVVALAAADLVSAPAGLAAGVCLALSTGHVYFSQDARMYPLLGLGLAGAVWGVAGVSERPGRAIRYGALYVAGAVVAVYAQMVSLVFLAVLNLAVATVLAASPDRRDRLVPLLLANLVLAILSAPWLLSIPRAMQTFVGLRRYPASTARWFFANMIGFPGLQGWVKAVADGLFVAALLYGAVRGWRAGRVGLSAAAISGLLLYPALLVGLNTLTPILENRVFLPCEIAAALLFGLAAASLRAPVLRAGAIAAVAVLAAASTLAEHVHHVKPEDDRQAFALADRLGYQGAPVLTCSFLPAASAYLNDPGRAVFFMAPDGPVRMDGGFYRAIAMSMAQLHRARTADYAAFIGRNADGRLNEATLRQAGRVIVLQSWCSSGPEHAFLRSLNYVHRDDPKLTAPGRVVFNSVWTQPELWSRPPV